MQIIKSIIKLTVFLCPIFATAQSVTLPQDDKSEHFLERMDIKQQTNYDLILSVNKPLERKTAVNVAWSADSLSKLYPNNSNYALSKVDQYNLNSTLINNIEWTNGNVEDMMSKQPWFNTFYVQKANFYTVNTKDFFLAVNPVIQQIQSKESGNSQTVFLNSK